MGWGKGWARCPVGNTGRGLRERHEDWDEEIQARPEGSWQSPRGGVFGVCLKVDGQDTADGSRVLLGSERVPPACTAQVTASVWVSLWFPSHSIHQRVVAQSAGWRPGPAGRQMSSCP